MFEREAEKYKNYPGFSILFWWAGPSA